MRIIIIFCSYILLFTVVGCSSKYGVHKSYAFSRKMTAGNIPVDENNQPLTSGVQKVHLVYIEARADLPEPIWDSAWIDGSAYLIRPIKLLQDKIDLGKTKEGGQNITLQAEKENALWQLMLNPLLRIEYNEEQDKKIKEHSIILTGLWKNKRVNYTIKNQIELETIFGQ